MFFGARKREINRVASFNYSVARFPCLQLYMFLAISLFGCNAKIRALNNKTLNLGLLDSKNVERVMEKRVT